MLGTGVAAFSVVVYEVFAVSSGVRVLPHYNGLFGFRHFLKNGDDH